MTDLERQQSSLYRIHSVAMHGIHKTHFYDSRDSTYILSWSLFREQHTTKLYTTSNTFYSFSRIFFSWSKKGLEDNRLGGDKRMKISFPDAPLKALTTFDVF